MIDLYRSCYFIVFLIVAFTLTSLPEAICANRISVVYWDQPLSQVIEEISKKSGYEIRLEGIENDLRVSGEATELTIEETLYKILKRFNYTIVWDQKEKRIMVSIYASSVSSVTGSGETSSPGHRISESIKNRPDGFTPSNYRGTAPSRDSAPVLGISGEGVRFIESTRTTGR